MKKLLLWLVFFFGLYVSARLLLVWNRPNSDSTQRVNVEVNKGMTLTDIAQLLENKELIRDEWAFKVYSKLKGLGAKYQAGDYIFQKNLTFGEIASLLQHGKSKEIKITIPEGSTIAQIDQILAKKSLIKPGEFQECASFCDLGFRIANLEGYLFPSTYFVNPNQFSNKKFIQRMYNTFLQQIQPLRTDMAISGRTVDQVVRMASMIEREANNEAEMPLISGVLWKRLDEGIHLGVDATTRYELNDWKRPLLTEDFLVDTPYNTRRRYGLPPTAISNPGIEAIKAALYPQKSEYYYYLHDSKGQIHFAKDHEGHKQNKAKYLY